MTTPHSHRHRLIATTLLVVVAISLIVLAARRTAAFSDTLELPVYDRLTRLTWPWQTGHPGVVLVTIRDDRVHSSPAAPAVFYYAFSKHPAVAPGLESPATSGSPIRGEDLAGHWERLEVETPAGSQSGFARVRFKQPRPDAHCIF